MFKLINRNQKEGKYGFTGIGLPNRSCHLNCTLEEIENIKKQIKKHTKTPKDYLIIFKNEKGKQVIAIDRLSLTQIQMMRDGGASEEEIKRLNCYDIIYDG